MHWDSQGQTHEDDRTAPGSLELGKKGHLRLKGRRGVDGETPLMNSFLSQAHAQAWHSYNTTWRSKQRGERHRLPCGENRRVPRGGTPLLSPLFLSFSEGLVGISLNCEWGEPMDIRNPKDIEAAERYLQFCLGWFANPIYAGDYPQVMKECIGEPRSLSNSRYPSSCTERM